MEPYSNIEIIIPHYSRLAVLIASVLLIILVAISLKIRRPSAYLKKLLFVGFVTVTVVCTLFLAGSTIYLNSISASRGPVHYHADYQIWQCGNELELEDPRGFSNKIGTSTIHEHNDKRIHIEGVIVEPQDASLAHFFASVGGKLEQDSLTIPGHEGLTTLKSADSCPNTAKTELQVFVYKVAGQYYSQAKIDNPALYIISPESNVPPGDCIIIELDQEKLKTEKLCQSFEVAKRTGKLQKELNY